MEKGRRRGGGEEIKGRRRGKGQSGEEGRGGEEEERRRRVHIQCIVTMSLCLCSDVKKS